MRIAVLDLGTNSTRLLLAESSGGDVEVMERRAVITALGSARAPDGSLREEAFRRVMDALQGYEPAVLAFRPESVRVLGTSCLREAPNAHVLAERVHRRFGWKLEVISGREEAGLSFRGAVSGLAQDTPGEYLVVDVGGGSMELAYGTAAGASWAVSIPIGCVRLTEAVPHGDPAGDEAAAKMNRLAEEALPDGGALPGPVGTAVALAGTATSLAAWAQGLATYDPERVHGYRLGGEALERAVGIFAEATEEEIASMPGIQAGRADTILAGTIILRAVSARFRTGGFLISETDILDGAAATMRDGG